MSLKTIGSISEQTHAKLIELREKKKEKEQRNNVSLAEIINDLLDNYEEELNCHQMN